MEGTQFEFSYAPGVTQEQIAGFEMAGEIWSQYLTDNVTINIHVDITDQLPENVIGGALPGIKKDVKYEKIWEKMSKDINTFDDLTAFNSYSPGNSNLYELWGKMLDDTTNINDLSNFEDYISGDKNSSKLWSDILKDAPIQDDLSDFNDYVTSHEKLPKLWREMAEDDSSDKKFSALINGQTVNDLEKMKVTNANSKALGFIDGDSDKLDGYIVMSDLSSQSNIQWDYDYLRDGEIGDNSLDFVSVALHEVGHVLGFVSGVDDGDWLNVVTEAREDGKEFKGDDVKFATPLDLFRYSSKDRINLSMGQTAYFSIDGGQTNLGNFSTGEYTGEYTDLVGDGFQASHWKQSDNSAVGIMDPVLKLGQQREISALDATAMDIMGWDVVDPGELNWQELYDNALDNIDDALVEDRDQDVEKMIQDSETYKGSRSSRSRRGRRNQIALWQNIKFQTLDLSTVEIEPALSSTETLVVADYSIDATTYEAIVVNDNKDLVETISLSFEIAETTASILEMRSTSVKELENLDLSQLGQLIGKGVANYGSLD